MRRLRRRRKQGTIRFEIPPYRRRRFISLVIVASFMASLCLTAWVIDARLRPVLRELALAKAKTLATSAVNQAVSMGEARLIRYQDLMTIKNDQSGRPVLIQPNTGELNRLAAAITMDVQKRLTALSRTRLQIPLGQVLGWQVLGTWGPSVRVSILPVGTVAGRIVDSFSVAGINQTRHRVALRIAAEVRVVVPLVSATAAIQTDVPLAEAIIMGEVPGVYVGGTGGVIVPR